MHKRKENRLKKDANEAEKYRAKIEHNKFKRAENDRLRELKERDNNISSYEKRLKKDEIYVEKIREKAKINDERIKLKNEGNK